MDRWNRVVDMWWKGKWVWAAMLLFPLQALGNCFSHAAATYGLPESLLIAIAQVESGLRHLPPSRNPNGTYDIGVMRINSSWLPVLRRYGIDSEDLEDACKNVLIGAWILARNRRIYGDSWTAVGAYNVGCRRLHAAECERRRAAYSWKVYCRMSSGKGQDRCREFTGSRAAR